MRRPARLLSCLSLSGALLVASATLAAPARLPQQAFVWQHAWTPAVRTAVATHGAQFGSLLVLAAELDATPDGRARVRAVGYDAALLAAQPRLALAFRVGTPPLPLRGPAPFGHAKAGAALIARLKDGLATARAVGLSPAELHLDFDCPTAHLPAYAAWLAQVREQVTVPQRLRLSITALPTWLPAKSFVTLAATVDDYVLQVHSLVLPASPHDMQPLFRPAVARAAIARASALGRPFRVALPTHSYVARFDAAGHRLFVAAEAWPPPPRRGERDVRIDPPTDALAALVRDLQLAPPAGLRGLVWFRLPVGDDRLNLAWPTLQQVMAGVAPAADLRVETQVAGARLDLWLVNRGTARATWLPARQARVRWTAGTLLAADTTAGVALSHAPQAIVFTTHAARTLEPGTRQPLGWVRFERPTAAGVDLLVADLSPTAPRQAPP